MAGVRQVKAGWYNAFRPWTLHGAIVPVLLGGAMAYGAGSEEWILFILALAGGVLLQSAANLLNTYGDYRTGLDTEENHTRSPELVSGTLRPGDVKAAGLACLAVTALIGLYMIWATGWGIAVFGIAGIAGAGLYTVGVSYKYMGLGQASVFVMMGLLMLSIGVYLAAHSLNLQILYPSLLSTFISFSSIIYLRQKEDGGTKNWAVTILSLLLSALIVYALVEYSSLLGKGVLAIQNWLLAIGNAFLRFVNWLFSLIPRLFNVEDDGVLEWETDEQYRGNYELNGIIDKRILELIVIAIIVIIAFFTLLYFMKFLKVGGEKRAKKVLGEKRKGPGLLSALRRAFLSILSAIRVKLYIMRNKNNTKGLYFYLINRLKRDEERKMPGETAKEFLIRLSNIYELGDIREDLIALSEKINVAFYAEQPSLDDTSLSNAVAIRKKVNMFRVCRALTSLWNNLINSIKNYRSKKEVG